jgi:hypothetical protein
MIKQLKLEKNSVSVFEVNMRKMTLNSGKVAEFFLNMNERCVFANRPACSGPGNTGPHSWGGWVRKHLERGFLCGQIFGHARQIVAGYSGVKRSLSKLCDFKK